MSRSLGQSIRIVLFVSAAVAALTVAPLKAHGGDRFRSAIDAGVAGAVAGSVAGNALLGAMPPGGYYPQPYPAPMPNCADELQQERGPYFNRIGQSRVCY